MAKIVFNGSTYLTEGDLPPIGSKAPDVSLVNGDLRDVSLAHWNGKRKLVNIVPSIDIPACAKSIMLFDRLSESHDDVAVLVVSHDLPFAHTRFRTEHSLKCVTGLSAIRHAGFGENYGVLIKEGPLAGMFSRAVVVLDENNTIVHREHVMDTENEPDYAEAFRALGISIDLTALRTE